MSHRISRRTGATALVVMGALLGALLISVPAAPAASIYACQKKKGGAIRIVSSKTKCKKTEKKLKWSTTGPAGKNGTNGTNGTNGANGTNGTNGAAGEPRSARTFSVTRDLGATATSLFSADGINYQFACAFIFVANGAALQAVQGTSTGTFQSGGRIERPDGSPTTVDQNEILSGGISGAADNLGLILTNTSGGVDTAGFFTSVVEGASTVTVLHYRMTVGASGASACTLNGTAFTLPKAA